MPAIVVSRFGAGKGAGGSPSACTLRQNGVNTRKPRPSLFLMSRGEASKSPAKLCEFDAGLCKLGLNYFGNCELRRLGDLIPEQPVRLRYARDLRNDFRRCTPPQHQFGAHSLQACLEPA